MVNVAEKKVVYGAESRFSNKVRVGATAIPCLPIPVTSELVPRNYGSGK